MFFASDNTSPAHPKVLEALGKANVGYMGSYGADPIMDDVRQTVRDLFKAPEAAVYLVATGSAANSLSLATFCNPWDAVFCHRSAHIEVDECGAPEFFTGGAKLVLVDGPDGKMAPARLRETIKATPQGNVHSVQRGIVSITNVTEAGGVYSVAEIAALTGIASDYDLPCHMDGARFANALVATNASPAEMSWQSGIDVLCFGGTKNGLMGVEAVVIFDPAKAWEFELRRKRAGHLFSKHRFLSAQFQAYLQDGLWLEMAKAANRAAGRLIDGIGQASDVSFMYTPQANIVYATMPRRIHQRLAKAGAIYEVIGDLGGADPSELMGSRMVCSWCTTDADIDRFLGHLNG